MEIPMIYVFRVNGVFQHLLCQVFFLVRLKHDCKEGRIWCFKEVSMSLICGHCREVMLGSCDVLDVTLVQTAVWRPEGTWTVGGLSEWHRNSKTYSLSWCFSRSNGMKDSNSERLSLCICLLLGNCCSFLRGWEAGCMCSPFKALEIMHGQLETA